MNINYLNFNNTTKFHTGKVPVFSSRILDEIPGLYNAFSTKIGGISTGQYESMNLSFTVGDDVSNVVENFHIFAKNAKISTDSMVYSHQTHTTNVMKVTKDMGGMGIDRERTYSDIDGIVTNETGLCLVTSYADCVPLYIVDPIKKAIGLSHAGWRGTVNNIAKNTVELMINEYGCNPVDLKVFIGPSICAECYEVSEDVAVEFAKAYGTNVFEKILIPKDNGKFKLNLHEANRINFIKEGVATDNIEITDICTCCNSEILFSHRATKGKRGGLCAFLMLK